MSKISRLILKHSKSVSPIKDDGKLPRFASFPDGAFDFEYISKEWLIAHKKFITEYTKPEKTHNRDAVFRKGLPKNVRLTRLFILKHILENRDDIDSRFSDMMTQSDIDHHTIVIRSEIGKVLADLVYDDGVKNEGVIIKRAKEAASTYDYENDHYGVDFSQFEKWVQTKGRADMKWAVLYSHESLLREWWSSPSSEEWDHSHFVGLNILVSKNGVKARTKRIVEKNTGKTMSTSNFNKALIDLGLSMLP